MMNIKMAKAFKTLSYEASCVLAGVRLLLKKRYEFIRLLITTSSMMHL